MNHILSKGVLSSLLLLGIILGGCTKSDAGLATPKDVKITELTDHSVTIEWRAVKNATKYRYHFKCDASCEVFGGICPDSHISMDMLEPGTSYHFEVRAENDTRTRPADGGNYPYYSDYAELDFTTP